MGGLTFFADRIVGRRHRRRPETTSPGGGGGGCGRRSEGEVGNVEKRGTEGGGGGRREKRGCHERGPLSLDSRVQKSCAFPIGDLVSGLDLVLVWVWVELFREARFWGFG